MISLELTPLDTLFFGDGVPFFADGAQEDVSGVFPPHPPTLVGALRAALARAQGWSGAGRWPAALERVLGDGADLSGLTFTGPLLLRAGEPLYPAPRHLVGILKDASGGVHWLPKALLRPGSPIACDLGPAVRFPEVPARALESGVRARPGDDQWLTRAGFVAVLDGQVPGASEVVESSELWVEERRVGLALEPSTRAAKPGMLYSSRHVRLGRGVSIGVEVAGVPDEWSWPFGQIIPLGGESRVAELARGSGPLGVAPSARALAAIEASGRVLMVALTPVDVEARLGANPGFPADAGDVEVVTAAAGRPQRIGGWSTLSRQPLPLASVMPAGSVLFCQAREPRRLVELLRQGGFLRVGARTAWGFGLVALGTWPVGEEKKS